MANTKNAEGAMEHAYGQPQARNEVHAVHHTLVGEELSAQHDMGISVGCKSDCKAAMDGSSAPAASRYALGHNRPD